MEIRGGVAGEGCFDEMVFVQNLRVEESLWEGVVDILGQGSRGYQVPRRRHARQGLEGVRGPAMKLECL